MTARAPVAGQGLPILAMMSGSFGLDLQFGYNINLDNDKVNIWMGNDRNKEMLMYLNKLYKEKLLDPEMFSQKEADYLAKQGTGNTGFFFDQTNNNFLKIQDQYTGIAPLKGPHGDQLQSQGAPVARDFGAFAITSVNKYPEVTMRWIDYFYSDEGSTLLRFGREGENYEVKDGIPYYTKAFIDSGNQSKLTPYAGGGAPHLISEKVASFINPPQVQEAQKKLDPYMPKVRYAAPMFDEATAQKGQHPAQRSRQVLRGAEHEVHRGRAQLRQVGRIPGDAEKAEDRRAPTDLPGCLRQDEKVILALASSEKRTEDERSPLFGQTGPQGKSGEGHPPLR
ncbi:hypothetical protein [Cohnella ginsengisoli]|uniref:hypothetical protein n=1 Tax=Cohnella ginsengisoli TaxID=425004 RepID=UPI0030B8C331